MQSGFFQHISNFVGVNRAADSLQLFHFSNLQLLTALRKRKGFLFWNSAVVWPGKKQQTSISKNYQKMVQYAIPLSPKCRKTAQRIASNKNWDTRFSCLITMVLLVIRNQSLKFLFCFLWSFRSLSLFVLFLLVFSQPLTRKTLPTVSYWSI